MGLRGLSSPGDKPQSHLPTARGCLPAPCPLGCSLMWLPKDVATIKVEYREVRRQVRQLASC